MYHLILSYFSSSFYLPHLTSSFHPPALLPSPPAAPFPPSPFPSSLFSLYILLPLCSKQTCSSLPAQVNDRPQQNWPHSLSASALNTDPNIPLCWGVNIYLCSSPVLHTLLNLWQHCGAWRKVLSLKVAWLIARDNLNHTVWDIIYIFCSYLSFWQGVK